MVIGPRNSQSITKSLKQNSLKKSKAVKRNASKNKEVLQLLFADCCLLVKFLKNMPGKDVPK